MLSFEFNTAFLDATMICLDKKLFEGDSIFNFAFGDPAKFELDKWASKTHLREYSAD